MSDQSQSSSRTYRAECPGCEDKTAFSKDDSFGLLSCDSCGYTPRKSVRDDIRKRDTDADQQEADHDE